MSYTLTRVTSHSAPLQYVSPSACPWAYARCILSSCFFHCFKMRECDASHTTLLQLFNQYCGAYRFCSLAEGLLIHVLFHLMAQPTSNFWCALKLVIPVGSYQIYKFTFIWLVDHFDAQSHIYHGFIGKCQK